MGQDPERPHGRYAWVTWLTKLLAGDNSCWYAAWYKARFKYEKIEDPTFDIDSWKAKHAKLQEQRVDELKEKGAVSISVEDQNAFKVQGRAVTIAGKPDVIVSMADGSITIEDMKSGKRRASDTWQVIMYLVLMPMVVPKLKEAAQLFGRVIYPKLEVPVPPPTEEHRARVIHGIGIIGADEPPEATPSFNECRWCDIANCQYRSGSEAVGTTTEF